jgi:hypothetical protein
MQQQAVQQNLNKQAYQWRADGDDWIMSVQPTPGGRP